LDPRRARARRTDSDRFAHEPPSQGREALDHGHAGRAGRARRAACDPSAGSVADSADAPPV